MLQVYTEFELMCGPEAVETIRSNWEKYVPELVGESPTEPKQDINLRALRTLDKRLRPSGPCAKSPAVFSVYEVNKMLVTWNNME